MDGCNVYMHWLIVSILLSGNPSSSSSFQWSSLLQSSASLTWRHYGNTHVGPSGANTCRNCVAGNVLLLRCFLENHVAVWLSYGQGWVLGRGELLLPVGQEQSTIPTNPDMSVSPLNEQESSWFIETLVKSAVFMDSTFWTSPIINPLSKLEAKMRSFCFRFGAQAFFFFSLHWFPQDSFARDWTRVWTARTTRKRSFLIARPPSTIQSAPLARTENTCSYVA